MFRLKKLYYTYIDPSAINHYRLFIVTETYQNAVKQYFDKWPTATGWPNLDKALYEIYPESKIDCDTTTKINKESKAEFIRKINLICKNDLSCKKYGICERWFQDYYVEKDYNYEKNLDDVLNRVKSDIEKNNL